MKFFFALYLLAFVALAACTPLSPSLGVRLTWIENSDMQITIKNIGKSDLTLVTAGSLFDTRLVQKITMHSGNTPLVFRGTTVNPKPITALVPIDFTTLRVGQSFSIEFDAAEMYDLSSSGTFTAEAAGSIWDAGSSGFVSYKSNSVKFTVKTAMTKKQSNVDDYAGLKIDHTCSRGKRELLENALAGCELYAMAGAHAAWNKTANHFFQRYFKTTKEEDLELVHDRLMAISKECADFEGTVLISCAPKNSDNCRQREMGYTTVFPRGNGFISLCDYAFVHTQTVDNSSCTSMDMAGYLVAEHARFKAVYDPPTSDDNENQESNLGLASKKALANAGSHRYLAKAAYFDCKS